MLLLLVVGVGGSAASAGGGSSAASGGRMFLFTCFKVFFSSDCHISIVVNNQTLERSRIIGRSMSTPDFIS